MHNLRKIRHLTISSWKELGPQSCAENRSPKHLSPTVFCTLNRMTSVCKKFHPLSSNSLRTIQQSLTRTKIYLRKRSRTFRCSLHSAETNTTTSLLVKKINLQRKWTKWRKPSTTSCWTSAWMSALRSSTIFKKPTVHTTLSTARLCRSSQTWWKSSIIISKLMCACNSRCGQSLRKTKLSRFFRKRLKQSKRGSKLMLLWFTSASKLRKNAPVKSKLKPPASLLVKPHQPRKDLPKTISHN